MVHTGRKTRGGYFRPAPSQQSGDGAQPTAHPWATAPSIDKIGSIRPVGQDWAGEKLVLHKLRFHPDFVAPFPPLANFEVALLESRPEGAATFQPRAPPWELDRVLRIATP